MDTNQILRVGVVVVASSATYEAHDQQDDECQTHAHAGRYVVDVLKHDIDCFGTTFFLPMIPIIGENTEFTSKQTGQDDDQPPPSPPPPNVSRTC